MRRSPLSRERILDAALAIVDGEGLESLSMRRVGQALGVEAMSLYNHVPSKDALLDGIHERILTALAPPPITARTWRALAKHEGMALYRALVAHPNAIPLFAERAATTSASLERLDFYLELLTEAGFGPAQAVSIVNLIAQLVVGHAIWMHANERVGRPRLPDPELELGIDALLTGFEAKLRRRG